MFPALPAMPRKLIDRSMDPPRRRPLRDGGGRRRGEERSREPLRQRINWPGEGPRREGRGSGGVGAGAAAAAEEIGAGDVGSDAAEASRGKLAWLGGDGAGRRVHGGLTSCLLDLL